MEVVVARLTIMCVVLICMTLIFTTQSDARIDAESIMGMWLFDEGKGNTVKDVSGNGHDGKFVNAVKWTEGKFGKALEFKGQAYLDHGNQEALNVGTNNFSIVAWFKYSETPPDWHATIAEKADFAQPRHGYLLAVRGKLDAARQGRPLFWFGLAQGPGVHLFGTSPINDGKWRHLAATVDRKGAMKMYRDGIFESQMDIAGFAKQNENNQSSFMIGGERGTRTLEEGAVDEVALFNVVLTEDDIKNIVQNGLQRALGGAVVSLSGELALTWGSIKTEGKDGMVQK